jgi:hypothetical protein
MSHLKKYKKIKYLGKGSYGAAILVELRADAMQKFVIKEIVIGHLKQAEQEERATAQRLRSGCTAILQWLSDCVSIAHLL